MNHVDDPKTMPNFEHWAKSCFALSDPAMRLHCVIIALKDAYFYGLSSHEPLSDEALEKKIKQIYTEYAGEMKIAYERGWRDCEARVLRQ